jgi:hypothetical protein
MASDYYPRRDDIFDDFEGCDSGINTNPQQGLTMSGRRFVINWTTGDKDSNLSQKEVDEIAVQVNGVWTDGNIVGKDDGVVLARVDRCDDY